MKPIFKSFCVVCLIFNSLSTFSQHENKLISTDPVCGVTVDPHESYDWKYAGKVYSFHSSTCRQAFKMNPQQFLLKSCIADMTAIDAVCGMKVNKLESYKKKEHSVTYYFCSYDCKETFKMWPERFINNKCMVSDSVTYKHK